MRTRQGASDLSMSHVRWMIRRDMPEVMEIESKSFDCPWSEEDFIKALRQRNNIGMVSEVNGEVAGYVVYTLNKRELEIINLAVKREYRRCYIGSQIIEKLIGKLSSDRRNKIVSYVRESNLDAQLFFKFMGFLATGVHYDYYETDHAYRFVYQI